MSNANYVYRNLFFRSGQAAFHNIRTKKKSGTINEWPRHCSPFLLHEKIRNNRLSHRANQADDWLRKHSFNGETRHGELIVISGLSITETGFDSFLKVLYQSTSKAGFAVAGYLGFVISKWLVFCCHIAQNPRYCATLSGRFIERLIKAAEFGCP